jgi:tetratricopeptide (TPR) repeat protein
VRVNLEQKLRQLRRTSKPRDPDRELERTLEYLRRLEQPAGPRPLPAQRAAKGIEEYVEGELARNDCGEYFLARQTFPFGRPYGKLRIGDIPTADLSPLNLLFPGAALPAPSRLVFLDTETTGLAGGTGTCAFLIGIGTVDGTQFVVRQFFLRDYPEEKAVLRALAEVLESSDGLVTYNGKTFDVPLLETRYALARLGSPFTRLLHLDALHPARRLWKLRLESCKLTDLESAVLGIGREGDVPGSEIPGIYFDYLRTGDARGLQPVFYHNALDIITLAALTVELARAIGDAGADTLASPVDLFSLSRIYEAAGSREQSVATCQRALSGGLPEEIEARALRQLAMQHKRQGKHQLAVEIWLELARRPSPLALEAFEELAIHYEHHRRDPKSALDFTLAALERLREHEQEVARSCVLGPRFVLEYQTEKPQTSRNRSALPPSIPSHVARFTHRMERLQRKVARRGATQLPIA